MDDEQEMRAQLARWQKYRQEHVEKAEKANFDASPEAESRHREQAGRLAEQIADLYAELDALRQPRDRQDETGFRLAVPRAVDGIEILEVQGFRGIRPIPPPRTRQLGDHGNRSNSPRT